MWILPLKEKYMILVEKSSWDLETLFHLQKFIGLSGSLGGFFYYYSIK